MIISRCYSLSLSHTISTSMHYNNPLMIDELMYLGRLLCRDLGNTARNVVGILKPLHVSVKVYALSLLLFALTMESGPWGTQRPAHNKADHE